MISKLTYVRRSIVVMACAAAAALSGCVAEEGTDTDSAESADSISKHVDVGIWTKDASVAALKKREQDLGIAKLDHALLFMNIKDIVAKDVKWTTQQFLDDGRDVVITLEFHTANSDTVPALKDIAEGKYDAPIKEFAKGLSELDFKGHTVWVRPLHELNGDWYPWCINFQPKINTVARFKSAYQRISGFMPKAKTTNVKMQLVLNATDQRAGDSGELTDWATLYPGDKFVDMILFSSYNHYSWNGGKKPWKEFGVAIDVPYQRAIKAKLGGKPFGISETSSQPDPDDVNRKKEWFQNLAKDITTTHTKIKQVSFFLEDKGDSCWDWASPSKTDSCPSGTARSNADQAGLSKAISVLR